MKRLIPLLLLLFLSCSACSDSTAKDSESDSPNAASTSETGEAGPSRDGNEGTADSSTPVEASAAKTFWVITNVEDIRGAFQEINEQADDYEFVEKEYENEMYGGKMSVWRAGETVVKLKDDLYNDHGPFLTEYYFNDGNLFFVYRHSAYVEMREEPNTQVNEDRWYIVDGILVKHLQKEHVFPYGEEVEMSSVSNEEQAVSIADEARISADLEKEAEDVLKKL